MKRIIGIILSLCFVVSMVAVVPMEDTFIKASAAKSVTGGTLNSATFIIDPGHGGKDPGACGLGREEAADVLNLSLRVAQIINASGSSCALTRTTDVFLELSERASVANAGSFTYFVSIHRNAGGGVGLETYYYSGVSASSTSGRLATSIQNAMINSGVWTKNRGVKSANYAVLRQTNMAAALVEVGFIDSATDNSIFANHFETIATSIASGMLAMIGGSVSGGSTSKYQSCMDNPSGPSVTNKASTASLTVTQTGGTDTFYVSGWSVHSDGVSNIRYKIDSGSWTNLSTSLRTDVQNAITGYSDYSNCGYTGNISYKNLSGGSHTVTIQAVTKKNGTYTVGTISLTVKDPIAPTVSNVKISNVSTSGYRVSCTVSDNAGISSVRFPTWTTANDQDDIIWHEGTISGSTAYYDVKISEHKNEQGVYNTHIYAYDGAGNTGTGTVVVNLSSDSTKPTITNVSISNVDYWGFDVTCNISDNIGVTKVQFPTWTDASGQDDIKWYDVSVSGGKATFHVNTKDHGYQTGFYCVHLYAWDLWNNEACVETGVTVPAPAYPTDANYIPVTAINAGQNDSSSQVCTTGTFTGQYWGVLVLEASGNDYVVKAKYNSGDAKSVTASTANPIIAVHSGIADAYAAFDGVQVGDAVSLDGINLSTGKVLSKAHLKVPFTFVLVDGSDYKLDDKYVTINRAGTSATVIGAEFKCSVKLFDRQGKELADGAVGGTGCVVKYIGSAGNIIASATVVLLGDLDGDGAFATGDYMIAKLTVSGDTSLKGAMDKASDVNEDGIYSTADLAMIRNNIVS